MDRMRVGIYIRRPTFISSKHLRETLVVKGNKVWYWEDVWVGHSSLWVRFPHFFNLSSSLNSCIESLVSWDSTSSFSWKLGLHRNLSDLESMEFASLLSTIKKIPLQGEGSDYKVWVKESSGCFSCHSFFNFLLESMANAMDDHWIFNWKVGIPSKSNFGLGGF